MKLKYIHKVAEKFPYDYEEPKVCKTELWDFSRANENEESRKEAICLVASISYGKEYCKDPERLWKLLVERGHESPFEFVRCVDIDLRTGRYSTLVEAIRKGEIKASYDEALAYQKNVIATFKLKIPIFVARQIQRHRSFSYMEMSRRYVDDEKAPFEFWIPPNISKTGNWYKSYLRDAKGNYAFLTTIHNYKPEQARAFLPQGLYTTFFMQGEYRAWLNFFIHRLHPEAQEETRLVAKAMWELLRKNQPEIIFEMADWLDEWVREVNPIFTPARQKRAEWFREIFLK